MSPEPDTALVALIDREQAPLLARRFYGEGPASPITASLAQVPELLEVTLPFVAAALGPAGLDERAKEIAVPAHVRAARVPLLRRDPHCGRARRHRRLDAVELEQLYTRLPSLGVVVCTGRSSVAALRRRLLLRGRAARRARSADVGDRRNLRRGPGRRACRRLAAELLLRLPFWRRKRFRL
jgi:hypothetical protein